jgi:hypothetical protein
MVISVSAACWVSVDEGKMMLVLIYQVAATVVILVGNILCYRKTYRFGLYMSLVVSLFASAIFWIHILPRITAFSAAIPSVLDAIYFFTQFIGATALAYLLFVSTTRVKNSGSQVVLQSFTVLLWLSALTLNVGAFIVWAMKNGTGLSFAQISGLMTLVLVVLATIFALLTILLRQTLSFSRAMERATVCLVAGYSCFFCLCRLLSCWLFVSPLGVFSGLLYFIVPAAVLVLIRKLTDDELYGYLAIIPLGIDALFMAVIGYAGLEKLAPLGPSLIYLALMGALFWFVYWTLPDERRFRHGTAFKFAMLLYFEVSLCCAALWTDYDPAFALTLLLCVIALAVFHFRGGDRPLWAYRINEYGVVLVAAAITFRPVDDAVLFVVRLILVLACLALMLERVRQAATHSAVALREGRPVPRSDVETFTALALFLLIVAAVNSLADWSELPYVLSLACMVVALLVVALGFWSRVRSLRLTGLVVLVICVLKLTVVDIGEVNSLMRVVSFISGGVICFAISALYNFLVKLQGKNT